MNQSPTKPHPITALKTLLPQCMIQDRVRIEGRLNRRRLNPEEVERLLGQARSSARLRATAAQKPPNPHLPSRPSHQ